MDTPRIAALGLLFSSAILIATGCATEEAHYESHHKPTVERPAQFSARIEDPQDDCTITFEGDRAKIRIPPTAHDFASELEIWNAPRILSEVTGDFIIEVKVSGWFHPGEISTIEGRRPYNGGGLLIVADKHHHLSLQRGAVRLGGNIRHYANFELRNGSDVSNFEIDIPDAEAWLRLERHGEKIFASTSQDRIHWQSFRPLETDFPRTIHAGIVAVTSGKKPFTCAFSDLALYKKARLQTRH
jgi:regulation of enolase protein 1 (concanavalin A-like superfamily)